MSKKATRLPPRLPTKEEIAAFIAEQPGPVGRREIARAFHITGPDRTALRGILKSLEDTGTLRRGRGRRFGSADDLPEVCVLLVNSMNSEGDLYACVAAGPHRTDDATPDDAPTDDTEAETALPAEPPVILVRGDRFPGTGRGRDKGRGKRKAGGAGVSAAIGLGDRLLARLTKLGDNRYEARPIKRLPKEADRLLGVLAASPDGPRLRPTDRKNRNEYRVSPADLNGAEYGDFVEAEPLPGRGYGLRRARVVKRLTGADGSQSPSLIAIYTHGIPTGFSEDAQAQAEEADAAPLGNRTDLRDIPLITIDGADARDFDDAVWACPDDDPDNPGGWIAIVAIADVAWYVRPDDALDHTARERGNSVYFPDRVVPMLPEALSNGWCSLRPKEDRPCMAVEMRFDKTGAKRDHRFMRGLMRSAARLTYEQAQAARDGSPDDVTGPLLEPVLTPLYALFTALDTQRRLRGALELDLPERQILLDTDGCVTGVVPRARLDSHKLIEELMIAANVSAAETLEAIHQPCMYRVHDRPSPEKTEALSDVLRGLEIRFPRTEVTQAKLFNGALAQVKGTPDEHMVNEMVLRSQSQAEYAPDNIGHFGLSLRRYAHFTSPIRRYADLLVHRALISGNGFGAGGLPKSSQGSAGSQNGGASLQGKRIDHAVHQRWQDIGSHITQTERRAAQAERDALNRFTVQFLAEKTGAVFSGRITGTSKAGLFVRLDDSGADGLVPMAALPQDYYRHDDARHCLIGEQTGTVFRLGMPVDVMLREANPLTGGLLLSWVSGGDGGTPPDRPRGKGRGSGPSRHRSQGRGQRDTEDTSSGRKKRSRHLRRRGSTTTSSG